MSDIELPPRLRIDGARIIRPNGNDFLGRGVSLGNFWLDTPQDAAAIAALGCNLVRPCLRWWGLWGPGTAGTGGGNRKAIDSRNNDAYSFINREHFQNWLDIVIACSAAGMWVAPFIDSNCGQNGTQTPEDLTYCDPYSLFGAEGRNFWTDKPMRKLYATVWQTIAQALRMIPRIAWLEIQPEPLGHMKKRPEMAGPCRDFYRYMMDAIREVDADTPFLTGAYGGYEIKFCDAAYLPERGDVIYTGNLLNQYVKDPAKFDESLAYLTAMRDERNVPIWVQQMGRRTSEDPDLSKMRHALQKMKDNNVGYAWWAWKQNTGQADQYALNYEDDDNKGVWIAKENEQALLAEFM
jgi:hypothetical protein